jgi:hypothetical protein
VSLGHEVTFVAHAGAPGPAPVGLRATTILSGLAATEAHLREEGPSYRFALLCRPWPGHRFLGPVRALAPRATVIYDTVDLHWVRLTRAARLTGDAALLEEAELVRLLERGNVEGCDATLAITEPERATLLAAVPRARVEVVPNIHEVVRQRTPLDGRRDLFFIGGFEHRPNGDAVSWFAAKILPRIRERLPEVALHVVGSRPTEEVLALSSPSAGRGTWPAPWFERSWSAAAVRLGTKGKIGQAMSFGLRSRRGAGPPHRPRRARARGRRPGVRGCRRSMRMRRAGSSRGRVASRGDALLRGRGAPHARGAAPRRQRPGRRQTRVRGACERGAPPGAASRPQSGRTDPGPACRHPTS